MQQSRECSSRITVELSELDNPITDRRLETEDSFPTVLNFPKQCLPGTTLLLSPCIDVGRRRETMVRLRDPDSRTKAALVSYDHTITFNPIVIQSVHG